MTNFAIKTLFLGAALGFLLAACENVPEVYKRGIRDLPQPEVSLASSASHQINFSGQGGSLSENDKASLQEFIAQNGVRYGDRLYIDFAPNDPAIWDKKKTLDNYLKTIGIWVDGVTTTGNNNNSSTAVLVVNRYQATAPDCVSLSRETFVPTELERNKIFGCVTANNLAAQVAAPLDLVEGHGNTFTLGDATYHALTLYRSVRGFPGASVNTR